MNRLCPSLVAGLAGLAVLGLVGCGGGDDVTPPPQPIVVTVTPDGVSIPVGGTQQMAAAVSGAAGATIAWTTSSPAVASVDGVGLVTGVSAGSTAITATATAADGTRGQGSATITVTSVQATPATISINGVTTAAGAPVVLAAAAGPLNVVLDLERGSENVQRVELLVDDTVVGTQTFSLLAHTAPEVGEEFDVIEAVTIPFNSAAFDPATGVADFLNGPHTLVARVISAENPQGAVSPSLEITLANVSVVNLSASASGESATNPTTGIVWSSGDLLVTATPVVFTTAAPTVDQVTISLTSPTLNGGVPVTQVLATAPFVATFTRSGAGATVGGFEGVVTLTATSAVGGAAGPAGPVPAPTFSLDNVGPSAPGIAAMPPWVNGAFTFTAGPNGGPVPASGITLGTDGGVGGVAATFHVGAVTALPGTPTATSCSLAGLTEITGANETDLPGTMVSTIYRGRVVTFDALNNQTCAPLAPGGVSGDPFGADYIAPTGTEAMANPTDGSSAIVPGATFAFDVVDNASGFGATPLSGIITRLDGDLTTSCVFGGGTGCSIPEATAFGLDAYNLSTNDGYYTFDQITVSDRAGNTLTFPTRTYLLDQTPARFNSFGILLQSLYVGGAPATFTTAAFDNVDLNNVFGTLIYPTAGIQFPALQIGTFGVPAVHSTQIDFVVVRFMRCLNLAGDFSATLNKPNHVDLFLSDFAQSMPTASGGFPIPPENVEPCGSVGNVAETDFVSFDQNAPLLFEGTTQVDISGTDLATGSSEIVGLSVVADVALNTSVEPFSRVEFFYTNAMGTLVPIGPGTAVLSQTATSRLWTYSVVWNPGSAVPVGAVTVTAIGVDSNGDAVLAGMPQVVTTVP